MSITIRGNQENINLFDNAKDVIKTNGKSIDARGLTMGNSTDERIEVKLLFSTLDEPSIFTLNDTVLA